MQTLLDKYVLVSYAEADAIVGVDYQNRCDQCAFVDDQCDLLDCGHGVFVDKDDYAAWLMAEELIGDLENQNHYTWRGGQDTLEFSVKRGANFILGCVLKYVYRYPKKGGKNDLEKILVYLGAGLPSADIDVTIEEIEEYIMSNDFTYREAMIIKHTCLGLRSAAIDQTKKLIEEVYGNEE